jgi:hypothetical protein
LAFPVTSAEDWIFEGNISPRFSISASIVQGELNFHPLWVGEQLKRIVEFLVEIIELATLIAILRLQQSLRHVVSEGYFNVYMTYKEVWLDSEICPFHTRVENPVVGRQSIHGKKTMQCSCTVLVMN